MPRLGDELRGEVLGRAAEGGGALAAGEASVWRLLTALAAREIEIPVAAAEDWSLNLNSPAELAAALHGAP